MSDNPYIHRMAALASRSKTRIKETGQRGVTDASEDEIIAMAQICDLVLEDYPGPLTYGDPDLTLVPEPKLEALT